MYDDCGNSSVGRASRCQRECREFESRFPLQISPLVVVYEPRVQPRGFSFSTGRYFWLGGRVVMQRPAKPSTPVRFRPQPPFFTPRSGPGGGIGRHKGLKIPRGRLRAGSSPAPGTIWRCLPSVHQQESANAQTENFRNALKCACHAEYLGGMK